MHPTIDTKAAPDIQLKDIVTAPRLSKRSTAFSATLFVDGKLWGNLSDRGQGANLVFDPVQNRPHDHLALLDERIAAAHRHGGEHDHEDRGLDAVVARVLAHHLAKSALATIMARYLLFYPTGAPGPGGRAHLQRQKIGWRRSAVSARAALRAQHPACTILNELPLEDALTAYRCAE